MRLNTTKTQMADALTRVARINSRRGPLPITQCVKIEAEDDGVTFITTDLEITGYTWIEGGIIEIVEPGESLVDAKTLRDTVKGLGTKAVMMEGSKDAPLLNIGPASISTPTDWEKWPNLIECESPDGEMLDPDDNLDDLVFGLQAVLPAVSRDDARPLLGGVYFDKGENGLRLVATDSYRLASYDTDIDIEAPKIVVPRRALVEVPRLTGPLDQVYWENEVGVNKRSYVWFVGLKGALSARCIEGTFPNYRQLMPTETRTEVVAPKESWLQALKTLRPLTNKGGVPVRVSVNEHDGVLVWTKAEGVGKSTPIPIEGSEVRGDGMECGFNIDYLEQGFKAVPDTAVELLLNDPLKPALMGGVSNDAFSYLVMPVRL